MYCVECGREIQDGVKFCTYCGAEQTMSQFVSQPTEEIPFFTEDTGETQQIPMPINSHYMNGSTQGTSAPAKNSGKYIAAAVGAVAALLTFALVGVLVIYPQVTGGKSLFDNLRSDEAQVASEGDQQSDADKSDKSEGAVQESSGESQADSSGGVVASVTASDASQASTASSGEYILPESDSRYYTESELASKSAYDLYIARNEIFARHGRGFKSAELQDYFNAKSWYSNQYSPEQFDSMDMLNKYEKQNVDLIKQVEHQISSPYL